MPSQFDVADRAFGGSLGDITSHQRGGDRKPYYEQECGKSAADLMRNYTQSESFLTHLFAEQRSNLLLVTGNHYTGQRL
jgi:hypothetical protein